MVNIKALFHLVGDGSIHKMCLPMVLGYNTETGEQQAHHCTDSSRRTYLPTGPPAGWGQDRGGQPGTSGLYEP